MKQKTLSINAQVRSGMTVGMAEALGQSEAFLTFQERLSRVAQSTGRFY